MDCVVEIRITADTNAAVLWHFLLMIQTCLLAWQVGTRISLEMITI